MFSTAAGEISLQVDGHADPRELRRLLKGDRWRQVRRGRVTRVIGIVNARTATPTLNLWAEVWMLLRCITNVWKQHAA